MKEPIDFVVLYCDGNDPVFREKRRRYLPNDFAADDPDVGDARYRDMGTLHYWFRAVEANAPWVRTIHLVTDHQVPDWIVRDHPKLHLVDHTDIIPEEFLPLFNSAAIELFVGRIQGLAEHFVFFNDDTYLNSPVQPEDFFRQGLPCFTPRFTNHFPEGDAAWYYLIYNDYRTAIRYCNSRKKYMKVLRSAIGREYDRKVAWHNFLLIAAATLARTGCPFPRTPHQANPMLRSTFELMWRLEEESLLATARHRFRQHTDMSQRLFVFYNIMSGKFKPHKVSTCYALLGGNNHHNAISHLRNASVKLLCINDNTEGDFDQLMGEVLDAFAIRYPQPCSFEVTNKQ